MEDEYGESAEGVNAAWWVADSWFWMFDIATQKSHMIGWKIFNKNVWFEIRPNRGFI